MSSSYFTVSNLTSTSTSPTLGNSAVTEILTGAYGTSGTEVTASTLTFAGGSISFSGGAGTYLGYSSGAWAPGSSTTGTGGIANDYFTTASAGSVTFAFSTTENFFGLEWGSLSGGNTLTFYKNGTAVYTLSYTTLTNAGLTAQNTYYIGVNIAGGYDQVVASGSTFEFANVSYSASTSIPSAAALTTGTGAQTTTPYFTTTSATTQYLCFLEGTLIATPTGEVPVESLAPGDMVLTHNGPAQPVRWRGERRVASRFADPLRAYPIRIQAGALADGLPLRDLWLSPDHALLVDGILIQAAALVNGITITRASTMLACFTYHHIELPTHSLLLAEGAPAESFVDNVDRMAFDNWADHPEAPPIPELPLPRAKSVRQVPPAIKARLAARAANFTAAQAA
ncbi:Hint domain-containing protein [Acidocella sp.]|uniref:Hint domain-containing protein n=1 Tax=Acidocella sp. TaxID=50710 RepID=UPI00260FE0A7|nr:Hint domain-containing protein [Acidocella sp.]